MMVMMVMINPAPLQSLSLPSRHHMHVTCESEVEPSESEIFARV